MLRYHTVALQSAFHQNEFAMFDRLSITWPRSELSELSVLNLPRSISKRIFSRTAPLKTNVTYYGLWEREACL